MLSKILINSGPITYIGTWIIVILILIFFNMTYAVKTALISYAILPIGSICQSILGYLLFYIGL
jgi:hypothetical protein